MGCFLHSIYIIACPPSPSSPTSVTRINKASTGEEQRKSAIHPLHPAMSRYSTPSVFRMPLKVSSFEKQGMCK